MNAFKIIYHPLIVHASKILLCALTILILTLITATCRISSEHSEQKDRNDPAENPDAFINKRQSAWYFCAIQMCLKQEGRFTVQKEQRKNRTMAATGFSEPPL